MPPPEAQLSRNTLCMFGIRVPCTVARALCAPMPDENPTNAYPALTLYTKW